MLKGIAKGILSGLSVSLVALIAAGRSAPPVPGDGEIRAMAMMGVTDVQAAGPAAVLVPEHGETDAFGVDVTSHAPYLGPSEGRATTLARSGAGTVCRTPLPVERASARRPATEVPRPRLTAIPRIGSSPRKGAPVRLAALPQRQMDPDPAGGRHLAEITHIPLVDTLSRLADPVPQAIVPQRPGHPVPQQSAARLPQIATTDPGRVLSGGERGLARDGIVSKRLHPAAIRSSLPSPDPGGERGARWDEMPRRPAAEIPVPSLPSQAAGIAEMQVGLAELSVDRPAGRSGNGTSQGLSNMISPVRPTDPGDLDDATGAEDRPPSVARGNTSLMTAATRPSRPSTASPLAARADRAGPELRPMDTAALDRNAVAFVADAIPLLSVIVLDRGGPLVDVPGPVTIAVDAGLPDAARRADIYRDRGYEVAEIPARQAATIPEAVAAIVAGSDTALLSRLAGSGHGVIVSAGEPAGVLNAAHDAGLPAKAVYRQIDEGDRDARAVGRFLDQAAFRAGQDRSLVVTVENRPQSLEGYRDWLGGARARRVSLAPVSAVIRDGS